MSKKLAVSPGDKYGYLTIVRELPSVVQGKQRRRMFECLCVCGNNAEVLFQHIRLGATKSCGCHRNAMIRKTLKTHGLYDHPLYVVWQNMKARCYNEKNKRYNNYGGRGIAVCAEWVSDVKCFADWAMSNGWAEDLQIDRENNDGNYEPGNCSFVTSLKNNRNTRSSKIWSLHGAEYPSLSAAAKALGVCNSTILAWCLGKDTKDGYIPAKAGCGARKLYA